MENKDGTFSLHSQPETENEQFNKLPGKPKIKAHELKTFLKVSNVSRACHIFLIFYMCVQVGQTSPDQKDLTPFIIEWIPDILPLMKIGELRIKFEYGHQRNGQQERRIFVNLEPGQDGMY